MLRTLPTKPLAASVRRGNIRYMGSAGVAHSHQPNAPIELDPSYQALMKDVDLSLLRHKVRHPTDPHTSQPGPPRELELYHHEDILLDDDLLSPEELESQDIMHSYSLEQKSPAALFGSQRLGHVVLPLELQQTIIKLISTSDKPMIHADAKRLFLDESGGEVRWDHSYDVKYKSREQQARHAERDGTAFASVALPVHYSAIYAVFDHIKQRLGPNWGVERVIDWGSGAGSGLWAASHAFQKPLTSDTGEHGDLQIANSTLSSYIGIDKRKGLVNVAQRLIEGIDLGGLNTTWQKTFHEEDRLERIDGTNTVALSSFMLSSLPTPLARKTLIKEMWESGAEVLILIDHNTRGGFECIAEAREILLRFGRKEMEDDGMADAPIRGCHVVAPCPHDRACPLYHPGSMKLVCGFAQRLQRPAFVRKTKHSGVGHEDMEYSYVVIRRGARPPPTQTKVGRIGEVGRRELEKERAKKEVPELVIDSEHPHPMLDAAMAALSRSEQVEMSTELDTTHSLSGEELQAALRSEAYSWPRLVFPPLKKAGHIILDGCTSDGKIMRMTIPKSQGKQPFYDARKSSWGDIFPHDPKNPPQERYQPKRAGDARTVPLKGEDIGKRANSWKKTAKSSYGDLSISLKEQRRRIRKAEKVFIDDEVVD